MLPEAALSCFMKLFLFLLAAEESAEEISYSCEEAFLHGFFGFFNTVVCAIVNVSFDTERFPSLKTQRSYRHT